MEVTTSERICCPSAESAGDIDWAEPLQKADLGGEEAEEKQRVTGGREEPPPDKYALSREALGEAA